MAPQAAKLNSQAEAFRLALLTWYKARGRDLPWRRSPNLYTTVVSEFMLQQTQVKTALPYFERWVRDLPTFETLAAAEETTVLRLWEGLGYYRRARLLRQLAQTLVGRGSPPRSPEEWLAFPGIGPYSAAAICSISFGIPIACVDGNVVRVLARLSGDETHFANSSTAATYFRPLAELLLEQTEPGDFNQAMMELGATCCTKRSPHCGDCPVRPFCEAYKTQNQERLPVFAARKTERRTVLRLWCLQKNGLLLQRHPARSSRLANLHELPGAETLGLSETETRRLPLLARKKRSITRFQIEELIFLFDQEPQALGPDLLWVDTAKLAKVTLSGPHRRWINSFLSTQPQLDLALRQPEPKD